MIVEIGHFALILAMFAALAQSCAGLIGGQRADYRFYTFTKRATDITFVASAVALIALIHAYLTSDFSVKNVVENSHSLKPLIYKIAGSWGNHEGSMLLWALVGAGFATFLSHSKEELVWTLKSRALGVQGLIVALVIAYVVFASNPFIRLPNPPFQGNDLNPLLQDPALAAHPPFLYLGYVGLSLVYSLAIAGLLDGKVDAVWARIIRPWALASWVFLTVGILLGAYWAYYELGWGGWWFWDPVENASFMPWLLGTALLHSAIVTEKRGALAAWTVLLAILAFSLSLLGTFLVRSGVLTSVHAFALDPKRGVWILLILALFTGGGLLLYGLRAGVMNSDKGMFAPVSRETALVLNNLFLVVATLTILVGTLYPLLGEAIYGRAISVGAPYFNAVFTPLMSIILVFLPVASFFSWKRSKITTHAKKLIPALIIAIIGGLVVAFVAQNKPMSAVGVALGVWLVLGAFSEFLQKAGLGKSNDVVKRAFALRPMYWGMFIAHLGVGVFVIGAVVETSFQKEQTFAIGIGETVQFEGRKITLDKIASLEGPNFYSDAAQISVNDGKKTIILNPARRYYPAAKMPTTEVDRKASLFGELYMALGEPNSESGASKWVLRVYFNPFIGWIFGGYFLIALGGLLSLADRGLRVAAPKASGDIAKAAS